MRQIGTINSESQARVLRSYLIHRGMPTDVEQNREGAWAVWVHNENQVDEAREILRAFQENPRDPEYTAGAREGQSLEKKQSVEVKQSRARMMDMRTVIARDKTGHSIALTGLLIAISVAVMFYQSISDSGFDVSQVFAISQYQLSSQGWLFQPGLPEILSGQVWRLITPIFLHGGLLHILFNMMWLWHLGTTIERIEGTTRLGAQVLLFAVVSNVLQYFDTGPAFGGMSGVNYGLFAYVWIMHRYGTDTRYYIDPVNSALMIFWFFACLFGWVGNIANTAHAAGLVLGAVWGTLKVRRIPFTRVRF